MTKQLEILSIKHLARRVSVTFVVCIWILAPYLILQQFSLYPVIWLEETHLDRMIPWQPNSVYVYFSYYLFMLWGCLTISSNHFVRLLRNICIVVLISHLCFFFIPTGLMREGSHIAEAPQLYQWLVSWEKPRNCLPSLHASLATLSMLALWSKAVSLRVLAVLWWIAILWSTLALKQHVIVDSAAGVVLATLVWFLIPERFWHLQRNERNIG